MENATSYNANGGLANGYSDTSCWMSLSHQIAELRREIGESECGIKETLHNQSLANGMEFCAVNKNINDNSQRNLLATLENRAVIKDVECKLEKSVLENRVELKDVKAAIFEKVDRETDLIKLQLNNFERNVDENFCTVRAEAKDNTRLILDRLTADKLDEKNEIIDRLRHKNDRHEQDFFIGNRLSGIEALVNSIKQEAQFSSKSIVFGNGANTTTQKNSQA